MLHHGGLRVHHSQLPATGSIRLRTRTQTAADTHTDSCRHAHRQLRTHLGCIVVLIRLPNGVWLESAFYGGHSKTLNVKTAINDDHISLRHQSCHKHLHNRDPMSMDIIFN